MASISNLVVVGQSGQGAILVSKILVTALFRAGRPVVATDYPAVSHRFSVTYAHIRTGAGVATPRIRPREADLVVGLEPFETLRVGLLYARPETIVVSNDAFVRVDGEPNHLLTDPIPVESVDDIITAFKDRGIDRVVAIRASRLATDASNNRAGTNMVMLGAAFASGRIPLEQEQLEDVIVELAPGDTGPRNRDGFRVGIEAYRAAAGDIR